MSDGNLAIFAAAAFVTAVLSSIAGGGGGFITTPLAILLGLPPQQAIATGKLNGLAISLGSVYGFRKSKLHSWRNVLPLMALALVVGLAAPHFITQIDNQAYRRILGVILLAMIPVILLKKVGQKVTQPTRTQKIVGFILITFALLLQAIFSGGLGVLVNLVLMTLLGLSALEANVTKRYSQVLMNTVIVLGLIGTHLIVWKVAAVSIVSSLTGGVIGSHIALKQGDRYVMLVFAILMFASGLELLFG